MAADTTGLGTLQHTRAALLGRDAELAALEQALADVRESQTRIVTLLGPVGIGKTRLIQDFILKQRDPVGARARKQQPVKVFRGSAYNVQTSYGLFARLLRGRFGLVEGMDPEQAKAQVRAQVAKVLEDRKVGDVVYFLGQLLDLPFTESPLTKAVKDDPQQAELIRRAVFKAFIEADAATAPLVLVFDDLQHAHDDSLQLLRYLLEYLSGPVLVLCAARAELIQRYEDWDRVGEDRHQVVELSALEDHHAVEVMRHLLAPCQGEIAKLVDSACAFAGGNPAMLEQMVRIYHDVGVLTEESELSGEPVWQVHLDRLSSATLPLTIEDDEFGRIEEREGEVKSRAHRGARRGGAAPARVRLGDG